MNKDDHNFKLFTLTSIVQATYTLYTQFNCRCIIVKIRNILRRDNN